MRELLLGLVILLAVVIVATLWRASVREAAAEAEFPPAGQFITVNGTRVHYVEQGPDNPDAPSVVLIHGASGNVNDWTFDMMARLSERYRVIAIDRPGLGYTDMTSRNASAAEQARLLADTAEALGADAPIIAGHSYGGAVALAWALERPDNLSGLMVLAGASNAWEGGQGSYYAVLGNRFTGPIMAALLSAWVPERIVTSSIEAVFAPQTAPDGYAAHYGPGLTLRRFSALENAQHRMTLLPQIEAMVPRYGDIAVPVEIVHGEVDVIVPLHIHSEPLSRQIPGAVLTVMPGVGHVPQHADPQGVVDGIHRLAARAGLR